MRKAQPKPSRTGRRSRRGRRTRATRKPAAALATCRRPLAGLYEPPRPLRLSSSLLSTLTLALSLLLRPPIQDPIRIAYQALCVDVLAEPVNTPMQVRPGSPPGHAGQGDALALPDAFAGPHQELRQVYQHRGQAVAVVDDEGAAGEVQVGLGQGDDAAGRGHHRGAGRHRHVDAVVRLLGRAVEDALAAEHAGDA